MASALSCLLHGACDSNDAMLAFQQATAFWTLECAIFALPGTTFEANHINNHHDKGRLHAAEHMGYYVQPTHETISIWGLHMLHVSGYPDKGHVLSGVCESQCCKQA